MKGWTFNIYSPLTLQEARALEDKYSKAFERFLVDHPEILNFNESTGMVFSSANVPKVDAVVEVNKEFEVTIPPGVLERLAACRSVIEIENPERPEKSRLQVSTLAFLLENVGNAVMDWGDFQLQLSETALKTLTKYKNFGVLGKTPVKEEHDDEAAHTPAQARSARIIQLFHAAESHSELSIDLQRLIGRQPEVVQRYMAYLIEHGPTDDAVVAKSIRASLRELQNMLKALHLKIDELGEEYPGI